MGTPYEPKDTRRAWCHASVAANSSTSEEVSGLKMNYDGTFMLDGKFYPLKALVPEEIYLGNISRVFWDACREKKMGPSLKSDEKKKNWRDKKNDRRNMKASATKTHTKSEEVDNSKIVFSDFTFVVTASPDKVQSHYASATSAIPEDPTIKDIFYATGAQMQVSATTSTS